MSALSVKIGTTKKDGKKLFTATVALNGAKPTKLTKKSDGSTFFGTRASAMTSARSFANKYGFSGIDTPEDAFPTNAKKAAKRSVSKRSAKCSATKKTS